MENIERGVTTSACLYKLKARYPINHTQGTKYIGQENLSYRAHQTDL